MASNFPDNRAKIARIAQVASAFTPSAPIDDLDLFAGRIAQIQEVVSGIVQKGQHVAVYGERGVGKTSLANILADIFKAPDLPVVQAVKLNCATEDDFDSLWQTACRELEVEVRRPSPENIRYALARLDPPAIVIIDELDRLDDDMSLTLLADTVKALSDHGVASTLVLVGVAESITGLIGEHASIARALVKIHMPRMSQRELREIIDRGCERASLTIEDEAAQTITVLSRGLPHFTHLLGLHAGQRAVTNDRDRIEHRDVVMSLPHALNAHVIESDYVAATHSPHVDNLYRQVLLACALAPQDQFGYFRAGAVRGPLAAITGRQLDIPAFARHLNQFLQPERGSVLMRTGSPRRYLYRFRDPILQTYVVLDAIAHEMIPEGNLKELVFGGQPTPDEPTPPSANDQLF